MNLNQKVRAMRRALRIIEEKGREERSFDYMMDGSGECGSMINSIHDNCRKEQIENALRKLQLVEKEYEEELQKIMETEEKFCGHAPWNDVPTAYYDQIVY